MDSDDDVRTQSDGDCDLDNSASSSASDDFDLDTMSVSSGEDSTAADDEERTQRRKRRKIALRAVSPQLAHEILFAEQPSLLMQLVPILIICLLAVLGISMGVSLLGNGMGMNIGGGSGAYLRLEGIHTTRSRVIDVGLRACNDWLMALILPCNKKDPILAWALWYIKWNTSRGAYNRYLRNTCIYPTARNDCNSGCKCQRVLEHTFQLTL